MQITLEQLLEAGVHFGHQIRRWNPKMSSYIYAAHEGVHIFDLTKTREAMLDAGEAVKKTAASGGIVLFVGTKRQAREIVEEAAKRVGMPYLTTRWPGGMLTNFEQIKKSIKKLEDLKKGREAGDYKEYTKRERLLIDKEISRLERVFGGVANLEKHPEMVFVIDVHDERSAVLEANKVGVPIVGVADTNADPTNIDYPIPGNDDATKSIQLLVNFVADTIEEGQGKKTEIETEKKPRPKSKPKKKAA